MSKPRIININFYQPRGGRFRGVWPQVRIGHSATPWRAFVSGGNVDLGFRDHATHAEAISYLTKVTACRQPHRKAA